MAEITYNITLAVDMKKIQALKRAVHREAMHQAQRMNFEEFKTARGLEQKIKEAITITINSPCKPNKASGEQQPAARDNLQTNQQATNKQQKA